MGFEAGRKSSIGVTALALTATSRPTVNVTVVCPDTNSAKLYFAMRSTVTADSADATDGFPLAAGEGKTFACEDPSKIYAISTATGQKCFWTTED